MKTALLPVLSLLLTSACVVTSSPPPDSTPPTPTATNAAPTPSTPTTTPVASAPSSATPAPTGAPASSGSAQTGGTPGPVPAGLLGAWVSPSCSGRTYARKIQFDKAGSFDAQDLVSPCPPKVQCIWSGIVNNRGTFTVEGTTVRLAITQPGGPKGQPLPPTLALDPKTSAPMETQDGAKCVYTKDTEKH